MQMIERVKEYLHTLSVQDKDGYEKRITACVEYLDGIGVTEPTKSDWQSCLEHLTAGGKIGERTAKTNYIGQAKNFYRWCVSQATQPRFDDTATDESVNDSSEGEMPDSETPTAPAMTDETEPDKELNNAEETQSNTEHETNAKPSKKAKDKSVRVNFLLDEKRYKKLAILAVLEDTNLTAILKEGIDLYISAHETQSVIAGEAISKSENARSE